MVCTTNEQMEYLNEISIDRIFKKSLTVNEKMRMVSYQTLEELTSLIRFQNEYYKSLNSVILLKISNFKV